MARKSVLLRQPSILAGQRKRLLSADFIQNVAQLVEVYRFDQMKIESRFFAAPNIFVRAKASERYRFNRLSAFGLGDYFVAIAIGKTNVAQEHIEFLRRDDFQRALPIIRDRNLVTKMSEQARQSMSCVIVVFHK